MPDMTLTRTRLIAGVWEGVLTAPADSRPRLVATHQGQALEHLELASGPPGEWSVRIAIPASAITEGVQTILITDAQSGTLLDHFTLVAGEALAHDLRAEVSLLRAELDLLKQAFRRHAADHP
jgi:hypothetical protein